MKSGLKEKVAYRSTLDEAGYTPYRDEKRTESTDPETNEPLDLEVTLPTAMKSGLKEDIYSGKCYGYGEGKLHSLPR